MSELHYGVNVESLLHELSQYESEDIGDFDVYGEDESGCEGAATIDITLLAADAFKLISELKAQRDALAAENAAIRASIPSERFIDIMNDSMDDVSLAEDIGYNTAVKEMIRDTKTPATAAYLNSVRADAIANALDASSKHCDTDCVMDVYDCSYEIAEMRSAGAIALHDGLVAYAAQLRAGEPS